MCQRGTLKYSTFQNLISLQQFQSKFRHFLSSRNSDIIRVYCSVSHLDRQNLELITL